MSRYLISFENGAMDHIPEEDIGDVGKAAHAVVREAQEAGVLRFTGGFNYSEGVGHAVVGTDGLVMDGPYPESKELIGGVMIVSVRTREEALAWAGKIAVACRCPQDVRMFMDDPELDD
ncbi:YciI family protein [Kribbella sp. WER1]